MSDVLFGRTDRGSRCTQVGAAAESLQVVTGNQTRFSRGDELLQPDEELISCSVSSRTLAALFQITARLQVLVFTADVTLDMETLLLSNVAQTERKMFWENFENYFL